MPDLTAFRRQFERMSEDARKRLDAATTREVAVEAECDPRTVQVVYAGAEPKSYAAKRARRVLIARGLLPPLTA